jgi:hypothetical protein
VNQKIKKLLLCKYFFFSSLQSNENFDDKKENYRSKSTKMVRKIGITTKIQSNKKFPRIKIGQSSSLSICKEKLYYYLEQKSK